MILVLSVINILLAVIGVYRSYIKKSMVILPWIIIFYFSITSAMVCLSTGWREYGVKSVNVYLWNWFACTMAFLVADFLFNKKERKKVDLQSLFSWNLAIPIEVIFWLTFIVTAVILRNQDYTTYVRGGGAYFWQNMFQFASFIVFYFVLKKQWIKVSVAFLIMIAIIVFTPVRSLLFFIVMPIFVYVIYQYMYSAKDFKFFFARFIPLSILGLFVAGVLSSIRFGLIRLPETELTDISLDVINYYNSGESLPLFYLNSWQHFFDGLMAPVYNGLRMFGIDISPDLAPSIPLVNASINGGQSDSLYVGELGHNPATLMHDFLLSFGSFAFVEAFVYYFFLLKLCNFIQKNKMSLMLFSTVFGWHIYMVMRGALDNACSGIGYSIWYVAIFYFLVEYVGLFGKNGETL